MSTARLESEDLPMLRGTVTFTADLAVPDGCLHAAFVRSNVAHGELRNVDLTEAEQTPGVAAVFDAPALGLAPFEYYRATTLGGKMARPLLADGRVRFVGEPVAVVLAESPAAALDAAELVAVDIDELPAVIDVERAAADEVLLYPDAGTNVVRPLDPPDGGGFVSEPTRPVDSAQPDGAPRDDPCAGAACVVELVCENDRISSVPIEPCAIVATPFELIRGTPQADGASPDCELDIWSTGQGVHSAPYLYRRLLGVPTTAVRVREPWVGGGFGGRGDPMPEFFVVARAAQLLRRPVRWVQSRQEQFVSMPYGRGQRHRIRMGFDDEGRISGIDVVMWSDAGAYPHMAPMLAAASYRQSTGLYRVPRLRYRYGAAVTNAPPVGAYRGAGQPEVNAALERAIDAGARELGLDPAEVRRRNLLRADELPYDTGTGVTIDSGDPHRALDTAQELIDDARWQALAADRRAAGDRRAFIGVGYGCYSQTAGSGDDPDYASLELGPDGSVLVTCGSHGHGQGHHSLWAQITSARVGIAEGAVRVNDADSVTSTFGGVTGGSRTASVLGSQIAAAATELRARISEVAAEMLEASADDIEVTPDGAHVAGVPSRLASWTDIAAAAPEGISATVAERRGGPTHPYGTHAAAVEVDAETGRVTLLAFAAVDDCGRMLHEASVEGQQHGGAVAGISQALMEAAQWDDDGTPRTITLMDYLIPAAADVPPIDTARLGIPTGRNELGTRGIGENGAIAAPPAVQNAVIDALAHLGVTHIDIPVTPQRVWEAVSAAEAAAG
ncbi:xanthine dehydrogenase family protein molybdopterin-binding subunit [Candidatus Poriferisodalis sp.]|uniref:xanthine dehydrogenase family protein molybdopterin-binding subunit n=1 Tax=Candidatus Poriferisodalis sp. TaxID=3101277 RepID=UPI003D0ADD0D